MTPEMLYLAYTFETTDHAYRHLADFWSWMADRNTWCYSGLDMILATSRRIETQTRSLLIHHEVAFAGETGLAEYRAALAARGRDPREARTPLPGRGLQDASPILDMFWTGW
ncbi:hypothetical protein [Streptomyces sp. 029-5]|uniref:hypothetical protein n=1 Tax=Streptomyces sp. 029-5 TaxID=2789261 RepID=UPI0039810ADE